MLNELEKKFLSFLKENKFKEAGDLLMGMNNLSNIVKDEYEKKVGFKLSYMHLVEIDYETKDALYLIAIGCYLESLQSEWLSSFVEEFVSLPTPSGFSSELSSLAKVLQLYCTKKGTKD